MSARRLHRPRLTYANVVSSLALFLALGGTSYAVAKLPRNSVGTAQLKPGAVTGDKLAAGVAISGPRGPRGAPGPVAAPAPEAWQSLTLVSGWADFAPDHRLASFRRVGDIVQVRGTIKHPTPLALGMDIAVLPPGYRPTARELFTVSGGGGVSARVDVLPTGQILWVGGDGGPNLSLAGIWFSATS